jgi:hypothetical protein
MIPVSALEPTESTLTVRFKAVGGSFTGTLNTDATELTGTFSQGSFGARHVPSRHAVGQTFRSGALRRGPFTVSQNTPKDFAGG